MLTLATPLVACGEESGPTAGTSTPAAVATATPDAVEAVDAALLLHFDEPGYKSKVKSDVLSQAMAVAWLNEDNAPMMRDARRVPEIRHHLSCVTQGTNRYLCEHRLKGKTYSAETLIEASYDSSTEVLIVSSERKRDGGSFPSPLS